MHNSKTFLAIIPARGGSKRLPRKNVLDLVGKPLIAWTIEAALGNSIFDEVMVTTDDVEIAEISKKYGANVPFLRPAELSSDTASSYDVATQAIEHYKVKLGRTFDFVVLLQPTSPLRSSDQIKGAVELLFAKDAKAVISVCEADHSPQWMNTLPDDRSMMGFIREEVMHVRSQDLPTYYRLNGAIYICQTNSLLQEGSFMLKEQIFAYVMGQESSVDIDTSNDFAAAKFLLSDRGVLL